MGHRTLGDYKFGAEVEDVRGSRVLGKDREALGVNATVRRNRGTAIDAACGQLRLRNLHPVVMPD